jgi:signal transduction histidine kinase
MLKDTPIRRKLMAIILLTSFVALLLMGAEMAIFDYSELRQTTARQLATIGKITAANSTAALAFQNEDDATEILAALAAERNVVAACLYDSDGKLFSRYPVSLPAASFPAAPGPEGYNFRDSFITGFQPVVQADNRRLGTLFLKFDTAPVVSKWLRSSLGVALAGLSVVLLVAFVLSRGLQRQVSQPIMALAETAKGISEHRDFSVRARKYGGDELGQLTDAFNQMLSQIQEQNDAIRESETRLQTIVENLSEGLVVSDLAGQALHFNRAALDLHGFASPHESQQQLSKFADIFELSSLDGSVLPLAEWPLSRVLRGENLKGLELRIGRLKSDWNRVFNYSGTVVKSAAGQAMMVVLMIEDITERKQSEVKIHQLNAQLELRVAQRTAQLESANRELEAFSYSVSHDLRAPLRHIDGFAELLRKHAESSLDEKGRRYIATIGDSAKRLGLLIDELLVFSRMGRSEMRHSRVNLKSMVDEVIRDLGPETQGRQIKWQVAPLPDVEADSSMLRQVWVNLLGNAVKYTRNRPEACIEIGHSNGGADGHVFFVRDNGAGFDMKYGSKLFGVFQRLHNSSEFEGTGIGLANVRRIIERHSGRTWADGRKDEGAVFYFSLPTSNPPA